MKRRFCVIISCLIFVCLLSACAMPPMLGEAGQDSADKTVETKSKEEEKETTTSKEKESVVSEEETTVAATEASSEEEAYVSEPVDDEEYIESIIESGGATEQAILPDNPQAQNVHVSESVSGEISYVISNYVTADMSSFEKAKAVHDYLVTYVVYDGSDRTRCHTADGALVDHRAVCDGYSKAFMLIMQALGYSCQLVYGWAGEYHAWNVVCLDGTWYQMDVTWDDPYVNGVGYGVGDGSNLNYSYFLLNDATMYADHSVMWDYNPNGVPSCTSTAGMEWINGLLASSYSPGSTATSVSEAVNYATWYASQGYGSFYILMDLNYVGDYTSAFNSFKDSFYESVKSGYNLSNISLNAWTEANYLVIKVDLSYW